MDCVIKSLDFLASFFRVNKNKQHFRKSAFRLIVIDRYCVLSDAWAQTRTKKFQFENRKRKKSFNLFHSRLRKASNHAKAGIELDLILIRLIDCIHSESVEKKNPIMCSSYEFSKTNQCARRHVFWVEIEKKILKDLEMGSFINCVNT